VISVCILTKNNASTIQKTLESTLSFPEVVILDNGSTDVTLQIAKQFPHVRIFLSPFLGFGPLRNQAASLAKYDWILALDSDEILSAHLADEIKTLYLKKEYIYSLPRHNFYGNKQIKGCGWHPERVARLYHRLVTSYCNSSVHESVLSKGLTVMPLKHPILHTPYRSTFDFLTKMQHYSTLFAEQHRHKKKSSFFLAISHAVFAFFRSYFLKRGLFDGKEGWIISVYNANTTFYKYLKLKELNDSIDKCS
jgi:glycosyltransferase involved in cell wall biosynthesis